MLTVLTAPTTRNLMAPATALSRLKLGAEDLDELTLQVEEASRLVARYLGYEPCYGVYRETFAGVSGDRLYLGARPAWSIASVTYRDGAAQAADSYRLERGPYGESSVVRPLSSGFHASAWPAGAWTSGPGLVLAGSSVLPDWSVDFTAGWWLEEMTGAVPAGVERFPAELRGDFLRVLRWVRETEEGSGSVKRMKESDAEVEYFSAKDQAVDPATGIPCSCTPSLALYRRAV